MEPIAIAKQFIHYQKSFIDNAFETASLFQEQAEKMTAAWLEKSVNMSAEGQKSMQQWAKMLNKGSQDYKKIIDAQISKFENLFTPKPTAPQRPAKSSTKETETTEKKQTASKK